MNIKRSIILLEHGIWDTRAISGVMSKDREGETVKISKFALQPTCSQKTIKDFVKNEK
jgi:hypothetical protein